MSPRPSASETLVLALDIGSSATRGALHDASGASVGARAKRSHTFDTDATGRATVDPDAVAAETAEVISQLLPQVPGSVAGIALDTFASSLVGVDSSGGAVTPCFTYADSRPAEQVEQLRREYDEAAVQQRTGTRFHTSYLPARLRWLRETGPDEFRRVHRWMSLGEYVYLHLAGVTAAGTSTAAWTGLLGRGTGVWDPEMLTASGITAEQLSDVRDPDEPLYLSGAAADRVTARWPKLAEAAWFPPIADGVASNIGLGAADGSTVALTAATSGAMRLIVTGEVAALPDGLWCYRMSSHRSVLGGALNDVGRVMSWATHTLQLGDVSLDEIAARPPTAATPMMIPFLTGERSTGWASRARAVFGGLTAATDGPALARAAMEGVALSYARIARQLTDVTGTGPLRVHAGGGLMGGVPALAGLLADVLGVPVAPVTTKRTTLRGTALLAMETLAPGALRTEPETGPAAQPRAAHQEHYREQQRVFDELYLAAV